MEEQFPHWFKVHMVSVGSAFHCLSSSGPVVASRAPLLLAFFEPHFVFLSHPQGCFIFSLAKYKPLTYNKVYTYPDWAIGLGWVLALSSMVCIPMVMVIRIIQSDGSLIEVRAVVCLEEKGSFNLFFIQSNAWKTATLPRQGK